MPNDEQMYSYDREVAEPLCAANISWEHQKTGKSASSLVVIEQTSEKNDVLHIDILEVVAGEVFFHDVKTVREDTRKKRWLDEQGNLTLDTSFYSIPCHEMQQLLESPKWKDLLDKFFFEFEEYQPSDPLKTTGSFMKVPFSAIAEYYTKHFEPYLPFILVPVKYIREHMVFKYDSANSDLDF